MTTNMFGNQRHDQCQGSSVRQFDHVSVSFGVSRSADLPEKKVLRVNTVRANLLAIMLTVVLLQSVAWRSMIEVMAMPSGCGVAPAVLPPAIFVRSSAAVVQAFPSPFPVGRAIAGFPAVFRTLRRRLAMAMV